MKLKQLLEGVAEVAKAANSAHLAKQAHSQANLSQLQNQFKNYLNRLSIIGKEIQLAVSIYQFTTAQPYQKQLFKKSLIRIFGYQRYIFKKLSIFGLFSISYSAYFDYFVVKLTHKILNHYWDLISHKLKSLIPVFFLLFSQIIFYVLQTYSSHCKPPSKKKGHTVTGLGQLVVDWDSWTSLSNMVHFPINPGFTENFWHLSKFFSIWPIVKAVT